MFGEEFRDDLGVDFSDVTKKKKDKRRRSALGAPFGDPPQSGPVHAAPTLLGKPPPQVGSPSAGAGTVFEAGLEYLLAVRDADLHATHRMQLQVNRMEDELRKVTLRCCQLRKEIMQAQEDARRSSAEQRLYEGQLKDARHRVAHLRADQRSMDVEKAGLKGDRSLYQDEMSLLAELEDQEEQELVQLQTINSALEAALREAEHRAGPQELEERRREVLMEVIVERKRLKEELRSLDALQAEFEQLKSEEEKEMVRRQREELRQAFRRTEQQLWEAESSTRLAGSASARGQGSNFDHIFGAPASARLARFSRFDSIFESQAPAHIRRHLAAGRPSADPLTV